MLKSTPEQLSSVVIAVMKLLGNDPHQTNLFQSANVLIIMMKFNSLSQEDTVCCTHNHLNNYEVYSTHQCHRKRN